MGNLIQFTPDTSFGTMTVNGLSMFTGCWFVGDMSAVLDDAEIRGSDRLIPMTPGVLARRRRRTVTRKDFPMFITGKYNQAGALNGTTDTSWKNGLVTNIRALRVGLGIAEDAPVGVAGTVDVVWTDPFGYAQTKPAHVLSPLKIATKPGALAVAVLSLEFPLGVFS